MTETTLDLAGLPRPATQRLLSLDRLRGLLMALMALDHAVYYLTRLHVVGEFWGGPYPSYDSALGFLTRGVTHLAATGFAFLLGVGQGLSTRNRLAKGWGWPRITAQFLLRGVLLIAVQLVVVNRAWEMAPGGWGVGWWYFGVLFALGGGLILTAPLSGLKSWVPLALAAAALVACAWYGPRPAQWEKYLPLWKRLALVPAGDRNLWVSFPVLSWTPPLLFGLGFSGWLAADPDRAMRRALVLGLAFLAAFPFLRWMDGFFNIRPPAYSNWIDFFNVVKYPPSITFLLLTMGIDLLLLCLFHALRRVRLPAVLPAFGRAALFFYVVHLFVYAVMGRLAGRRGVPYGWMLALWVLGLALLYLPCRWYGKMRSRQPAGSLLRLL
jgi:uncharacterized membrane protein